MKRSRNQPAPSRAARLWQPHGWRLLLLWLLIVAAYSNSFRGGMVFDNSRVISQDVRIRAASLPNIRLILTGDYWYKGPASGLYRPLTSLSYLLNYAILGGGEHPEGYHAINLVLHLINVSLVYALGLLILREPRWALGLAALWGLHPLLTDSVTNIVGRADLLAAFGVLAGLLCYTKATAPGRRRRWAWIAALAAAQTIGLFAKENAAVLAGILLLYDLAGPGRATWRSRIPAYAVLALPFAAFLYLRTQAHTHLWIDPAENPLVSAGFFTARITAMKVIGKFVWLFLWPARLSADYSYNAVPLATWRPLDAAALLAAALCLGAVLLAFRWRRSKPPAFFFILFFFVALAPTANLIFLIGSIMAERFMYLPSIGLAGCVILALRAFDRRAASRAVPVATAVVCLACAARTYARNFDWRDVRTFWSATVDACPASARAHNNLGAALAESPGDLSEAIAQYRSALHIRPEYADAHYNLGNALMRTPGHVPEAITEFEADLRVEPGSALAHVNLGTALTQIPGSLPAAIAQFREALEVDPDLADAHYNLGSALAQTGHPDEAIAEFQAAVRLAPDHARAHNNLGTLLARTPGRLLDAVAEFQAALANQPDYVIARVNLAGALAQIPGRLPDAIAELETALRIQPDPKIQQMLDQLRARRN